MTEVKEFNYIGCSQCLQTGKFSIIQSGVIGKLTESEDDLYKAFNESERKTIKEILIKTKLTSGINVQLSRKLTFVKDTQTPTYNTDICFSSDKIQNNFNGKNLENLIKVQKAAVEYASTEFFRLKGKD